MRRSVKIEINVLHEDMDIDYRNELVDKEIEKEKFYDAEKVAMDIEYDVVSCDRDGNAVLKATFNYE